MEFIKRHPRLYAIGGALMFVAGALATIEGIWSLFKDEPLMPIVLTNISESPDYLRWILTVVFGLVTIIGMVLLVAIFRRTGKKQLLSEDKLEIHNQIDKPPSIAIQLIGKSIREQLSNTRQLVDELNRPVGEKLKRNKDDKNIVDIPRIIQEMHNILRLLAKQMSPLTESEMDSIGDSYLEILGMTDSYFPELKHITSTSDEKYDREVMAKVLDSLTESYSDTDKLKQLMIRIAGIMNGKGIGIIQVRDGNKKYNKLKKQLDKRRTLISSELNTAIDNYLQFSLGLASMERIIQFINNTVIPSLHNKDILPAEWYAEMGIWNERVDSAMNEILSEVVDIIRQQSTSHKEGSQT